MGTQKRSGDALQTLEAGQDEARHIFWTAFFGLRQDPRMEGHVKALKLLVSLYAQLANPSGEYDEKESDKLGDAPRLAWSVLTIEAQVPRFDPDGLKAAFVSAVTTWLESCNLKADWVRNDLLFFLDLRARGHCEFGMLPFLAVSNGGYKIHDPPKLPRCDPGEESESEYLARVIAAGKQFYRDSAVGLQERKQHTEAHRNSVWLIHFQVFGMRHEEVAEEFAEEEKGPDNSTVRRAVKQRADLLGLKLRLQGDSGRPRN